jgi:mRNA interferase MazF
MTLINEHPCNAGDIVLIAFDPIRGTEQAGIRPALVISSALMHEVSRRIVVCPITRNMDPWPTKVPLPSEAKTRGMILADQVRSLDADARVLRQIEQISINTVTLVRSYVGRLLELEVRQP